MSLSGSKPSSDLRVFFLYLYQEEEVFQSLMMEILVNYNVEHKFLKDGAV
jgi:hypothetical protein